MHAAAGRGISMKKTITTAILTILLLTLTASTILLAYLHFFAADNHDLSGTWTAELDMTNQAAASAFGWLQDIEGVSVSLEDMETDMDRLTIQVDMTLAQDGDSAGTFSCRVSPESYEACRQAAYGALAAAFRERLAERLHMAGYTGGTDEEAMEALVTETFGMSTEEYLAACGPKLLPSLEDLQSQYDGNGTYETAEDMLTRRFEEDGTVITKTEIYIQQDGSLLLLEADDADVQGFSSGEYPVVYTLRQSAD